MVLCLFLGDAGMDNFLSSSHFALFVGVLSHNGLRVCYSFILHTMVLISNAMSLCLVCALTVD